MELPRDLLRGPAAALRLAERTVRPVVMELISPKPCTMRSGSVTELSE